MKYKNYNIFIKYFKYLYHSAYYNGHGIHSPFLYKFARDVIYVRHQKKNFVEIKKLRNQLLRDDTIIHVSDFGAGSRTTKSNSRKISQIASSSSISNKYGIILTGIVNYFKPKLILELGTSLGISTSYLCKNMQTDAKLYTIEGDNNLSSIAKSNLSQLYNADINFINGKFDIELPKLLSKLENKGLDFVFIDGNHTKQASINYFEQCLEKVNNNSVFVFDDIHWSEEMEEAWEYIKSHSKSRVCVDMFQLGIVFFRKELSKQNYVLKYF